MNKKRMISYVVILVLLVLGLGFGTYTLIMSESFRRNTITFKVGASGAYCKVDANYFLGKVDLGNNSPTKTYSDSYTQVDEYSNSGKTLNSWNLGNSAFVVDEDKDGNPTEKDIDIIVFKISIANLNEEKSLSINLSNVAACNVDDESTDYFSTKIVYQIGTGEEFVQFSNEEDASVEDKSKYISGESKVDILTNQKIEVSETLNVTITFKRRTKTNSFSVRNNMSFDIIANDIQ